jgi:hypothetical protein
MPEAFPKPVGFGKASTFTAKAPDYPALFFGALP